MNEEDAAEFRNRTREVLEECELEKHSNLEDGEFDPFASFASSEASITESCNSFNGTTYQSHTMVGKSSSLVPPSSLTHEQKGGPISRKLAQDPSFIEQVGSYIAKHHDSDAAMVAGKPEKGPRRAGRKLESRKKATADRKPSCVSLVRNRERYGKEGSE